MKLWVSTWNMRWGCACVFCGVASRVSPACCTFLLVRSWSRTRSLNCTMTKGCQQPSLCQEFSTAIFVRMQAWWLNRLRSEHGSSYFAFVKRKWFGDSVILKNHLISYLHRIMATIHVHAPCIFAWVWWIWGTYAESLCNLNHSFAFCKLPCLDVTGRSLGCIESSYLCWLSVNYFDKEKQLIKQELDLSIWIRQAIRSELFLFNVLVFWWTSKPCMLACGWMSCAFLIGVCEVTAWCMFVGMSV